ncbi:MAG: hypothetical protein GKR89_16475 [Candidatus Latescibacteria bacterium]|nr:hypothetical protein [Candidatus Latescibacterota bacterium]
MDGLTELLGGSLSALRKAATLRGWTKGLLVLVLGTNLGWASDRPPIQFVDVAAEMGIDFVHTSGISGAKRLPETDGSGAAFFDADGDADLDLYLVNSGDVLAGRGGAANRLYRNDGQGFTDITAAAGVAGKAYGMGVVAGDFDADGDSDLYLTNWGADIFYRNEGVGAFVDATQQVGLGNRQWGSSGSLLDADGDGDIDLFVANYVEFGLDTHPWCGRRDMDLRFYCDPRQYRPSRDLLYRNQGDGTFVEIGQQVGIVHLGNGLGVVSGDFDDDGDADLYVANDMGPNFHYDNQGTGQFQEIGLLAGTARSADGAAQAGMGVDAGDFDNDADLDLFVTNYQLENNTLYRNDGLYFPEVSFAAGTGQISLNYLGFGTGFFDYNNDGWLDLFVANGHVHDNIEAYDELVTYAQRAQVFRNRGGQYVEVTDSLGSGLAVSYVGRGSAFGDYDGDGDLDIALVSSNGPAALLRNEGGNAGHWLQIELEGRANNRDGIGAKVYVHSGGVRQLRQVKAGSGYQSTSQQGPFFGLGARDRVERLEVRWPSGQIQILEDIAANQILVVEEPAQVR